MGAYYPDDYGPYVESGARLGGGPWRRRLRDVYRLLLPNFSQAVPSMSPGSLLEIGCASGAFLQEMQEKGWSVEGIEFSNAAASAARAAGFSVRAGAVETVDGYQTRFDLIVGWMVLEHLHDPVGALKRLSAWSKSDGWLVISVPNAASWQFKLFKGAAYDLHVPNHLYHFTPASMARLLDLAGWKIERIFHQRVVSNLAASIGYKLEDIGAPTWVSRWLTRVPGRPGIFTVLMFPVSWVLALLGQSGRMTVWARRKASL